MHKRAPQSVLEIAIAKGGIRKGLRVATFVAQWTIVQQQLGRVPTVYECHQWWREPRSSWYDRHAEFREIFDLAEDPGTIAAEAIARMSPKQLARLDALKQLESDQRAKSATKILGTAMAAVA